MKDEVWLRRLSDDGAGWYFWKDPDPLAWRARPAPKGFNPTLGDLRESTYADGMVVANTPTELRKLVRQRYGWYDHCQTCGILARECGHRQPERRDTSG